jgi:DNA polymerase (family 10)
MGLSLSEYGITVRETGELEKYPEENGFYRRLGLDWIPPELREAAGEIERAEVGTLPSLVEQRQLRGDLHAHTDWSDGQVPLGGMADAARARGYEYLAVTDHSAGRGIAHGLDAERLRRQIAEIRSYNLKSSGFRLLSGCEVDIRADGSLDAPDELLAELDVVVASIHSGMSQARERMTERIIKALRNPHMDILGHPTARLINQREPLAMDLEEVMKTALRYGKALEINAMPSRLDLNDTHARRARELGVKLVISTDAHSPEHLDFIRFGIGMARRAWCETSDILNTRSVAVLLEALRT